MAKPLLVILAGPNGSGKSTLCNLPNFKSMLNDRNIVVINPDDLARQSPISSNALIWSGRQVHEQTAKFIENGQSFLVETTLSGRNHFKTLQAAAKAGYETALHFVYVSDVELAKLRVRLRVRLGGHDVPETDQHRRFARSFAHAAEMIAIVDHALVFRNDYREMNHELIAEYANGKLQFAESQLPRWLP